MIWTTTPWTLPANVAIAVHPGLSYAGVRYTNPASGQTVRTIVAALRLEREDPREIEGRQADIVDAPGFFPKGQHAFGGLRVGGEVQMRELGDGVAHRIVEGAAIGIIAALDVSDRDIHLRRGDGGAEAFEAVAIDQ